MSPLATCEQVATACGATVHHPQPGLVFSGMGLDSTTIGPGELFAAVPGSNSHGARFAVGTPAAAILTDAEGVRILQEAGETRPILEVGDVRPTMGYVASLIYGDPSDKPVVIGITGTSGKTTTSYLLEQGLTAAGHVVGLIGTTGTRIGGRAVPTSLTTPEAPTLQALFAQMWREGVTHVVMEVSSHALSLGRVNGVRFDIAGFTNFSQDHLDFHATMDEYFEAKALFFDPASQLCAPRSVLCIDDEGGRAMAARAGQGATTVSVMDTSADVYATEVTADALGAQRFVAQPFSLPVTMPIPGRFNVANALLAMGIAHELGVDLQAFSTGLAEVAVPGRMERIDAGQDFLAVVDYAHKPAAVAAVLRTVRSQVPGRVCVVIGAGGDRDTGKRPLMGAEAARLADHVIVTDDNPRSEDPAQIRAAVLAGALNEAAASGATVAEIGDRRKAIIAAVAWAKPGDGVVIAGKGHEVGQLIDGINHHFDDREELRSALDPRGGDA